jgi:hypothetical protein
MTNNLKNKKPLALTTQTVRALSDGELKHAAGGNLVTYGHNTCAPKGCVQ